MKWFALAMTLLIGACATAPQQPTTISEKTRQVIEAVKTGCSYAPTVASIASLVSKSAAPYLQLAAEVCLAVTSVPLADGGKRKVIVRGVVIKGRKV